MEDITLYVSGSRIFSNSKASIDLAGKSNLGEFKEGIIIYSPFEAEYLLESEKARVNDINALKKIQKKDKNFSDKYAVFKDLRSKGMIVKEGLKFGTDFRVYEKGQAPGKNHAPYLVYVVEGSRIDVKMLSAKARVAHSSAKSLLLAVIDSEGDVNYYELNWKKIR